MSTARDLTRDYKLRPLTTLVALLICAACAIWLAACSTSRRPTRASRTPLRSPTSQSTQPALGYRPLPTFLPTDTAPVDRVVTASPSQPQLAVQGVGVEVKLPAGRVLVTVTGPHVPPFVSPPPPQVTAVFDVSLARATSSVPVRLADFTITDQLGRSFHPTFLTEKPAPSDTLQAGHGVTFQLTAAMPTGEGRMYWSPTHGSPIVGWDFIVEND